MSNRLLGEAKKLPEDNSGITVTISRSIVERATFVTFKIPDHAIIVTRDKTEFMRWCANELMQIIGQMENF